MALITNYATLVTAVEDYLARSDLTTWVPNFLQNSQSRLYRDVRIRDFETALSGTISSGVLAVPASFVELKYAYVNRAPVQFLEKVTPEEIYERWPVRSGSEVPVAISREAGNFIFGPYPGDYDISGIYYAREALLSASNTTNWFTTNAPDILLYGAMYDAMLFIHEDERAATWKALYDQAFESIHEEEKRESRSGSAPRVRVA